MTGTLVQSCLLRISAPRSSPRSSPSSRGPVERRASVRSVEDSPQLIDPPTPAATASSSPLVGRRPMGIPARPPTIDAGKIPMRLSIESMVRVDDEWHLE